MTVLRKFLGASAWLFADRFLRLAISFLVGILIARYYGPQEYGQISFIVATAAIFGSISSVGLDDIIPRDLAKNDLGVTPDDIQRTSLTLRFIGGSLSYLLLMLAVWIEEGVSLLFWIAVIIGPYFIFQAVDIYEYRLRVDGHFNLIAKTKMVSAVLANALKISVMWLSFPITMLAAAMTTEFALNSYILSRVSKSIGYWRRGTFQFGYAKNLLNRSWKIILAGVLAIAQTRIEYFWVQDFLGWNDVGQYAAALKVVELFDVVTVILVTIMLPELSKKYATAPEKTMRQAYLLGFGAFVMLSPLMLAAIWLFPIAYGVEYETAYGILPLLMLRPLLMMLTSVRNTLLVISHQVWYAPIYASVGVIASLLFGWYLVPTYGLSGAAFCAILSLLCSTVVADVMVNRRNLRYVLTCWREILPLYSKHFGSR